MKTVRSRRNAPGRPEGRSTLRDEILDVAELQFAELGFSGTSMRAIAEKVEVTPAMVSYYFSNKERLFEEVFLRKGREVAEQRMVNLDRLRRGEGELSVAGLVKAFLEPSIRLRESGQGLAFLRLHSRLHMEPEGISYRLRSEVYDESTRAYAKAFLEQLPDRSERRVYLGMSMMIGAYLYTFSGTNRLDELLPDSDPAEDNQVQLHEIVSFMSALMLSC